MVGPVRPQFVLFGSSIVQLSFGCEGWGSILADLYSRKDAAIQPSLVIVYFGGNDSLRPHPSGLGPHVPLPEYVDNMKKIATHLKGLSEKTRLIFLTAPPVNEEQILEFYSEFEDMGRTNELCREYSDACLELCKEMDIKAIDMFTSIQKKKNWRTTCFTDGIHFTFEASKIILKEILKVLKEADWEPSLHFRSLPAQFGEDSPYDPISADGKTTINISDNHSDVIIQRLKLYDDDEN
ncbi:GDSL esterase/lipase CPRD49-like isoform X2 [Humulus lupulus]|uniref:GDSL esterase/lipase CPRD49-like isoform X2 n=1 Tax=Humulus lupulus TaxID=3486 RepID=UPI002B40A023|nr:GDSL esterase/lipase CPRD49-like isoform X2 [Humulus lupulus]